MIEIDNVIVSDEILEEHFICNLSLCKGQCCIDGESGAPLTSDECRQINEFLPEIWSDLSPKAQELIERQGIAYTDYDDELVTSIVDGDECVFTYFDDAGICKCVIEKAYLEGRVAIRKPISCHLYPIRVKEYVECTALNYHRWSVCNSAIELGRKEGVLLYRFLKEPLIRRFGEEWYNKLCEAALLHEKRER